MYVCACVGDASLAMGTGRSRRSTGALSSIRVDPTLLQDACARIAAQLRGTSMKEAFRVLRRKDGAGSNMLRKRDLRLGMEALGVQVAPGDLALLEEQFGEYAPDSARVRRPKKTIGPAAFATKPKRVMPMRGINYTKLLRRVYLEKLNPGGATLVFSPMSTKKRALWADGTHKTSGAHAQLAPRLPSRDASLHAGVELTDTERAAARMISTPPSTYSLVSWGRVCCVPFIFFVIVLRLLLLLLLPLLPSACFDERWWSYAVAVLFRWPLQAGHTTLSSPPMIE